MTERNWRGGPIGKLNRWADKKRAEKALGRTLSGTKHVIHHHSLTQIVICEDHAYHMLLHARMNTLMEGGNPRRDAYCSPCRKVRRLTSYNEHGCMFCQLRRLEFEDYCDEHNRVIALNNEMLKVWEHISWLYPLSEPPYIPIPTWPK